jgi:hypothetical protein
MVVVFIVFGFVRIGQGIAGLPVGAPVVGTTTMDTAAMAVWGTVVVWPFHLPDAMKSGPYPSRRPSSRDRAMAWFREEAPSLR